MDDFAAARRRMVETQLAVRDIADKRVLAAMGKTPRHLFVPAGLRREAYSDYPLPIGGGQTISQPYIVALMTQLLELKGIEKVLDIGTGSGYQTAVLAELAGTVCSIESNPALLERASAVLKRLGCGNVRLKSGDGRGGWPEEAPFDAILVAASADGVPERLVSQLKLGGRMVIPLERGPLGYQVLTVLKKETGGRLAAREICAVRFVPLLGGRR